ncbi:EF-hand domain-containing protein [Massilia sp. S19_KUP03_FR1]|uniref:EF-hand domain-containing protein n=1 Tax=Massilia sp. S19_KUP03_FR1 TaxID=3025503 RepID=UPI002FCDCB1D
MVASISSSTVSNWSDSLFNKLDTKKQGYVDQSDLAAALGTDETGSTTNSDDAATMLKQFDGDSDGKITKSELSSAISKVADELNAQFDSSRVDKSQVAAAGAAGVADTDDASSTDEDDSTVSATASASTASSTKAAPAAGGGTATAASSTESTNKYVQAADTDTSGDVSDDEAAAYKKLMAKQAEAKAGPKPSEAADSDKDLARALDMLKQYVDNSGAAGSTSSATSTVDTSA